MAIKKGKVRLQVTVSEGTLRDLDELRGYDGMSRSNAVSCAIFNALIQARLEQMEKNKRKEAEESADK